MRVTKLQSHSEVWLWYTNIMLELNPKHDRPLYIPDVVYVDISEELEEQLELINSQYQGTVDSTPSPLPPSDVSTSTVVITTLSQVVRTLENGKTVVDVTLDVDNGLGQIEFEARINKQ